MAEKGRWPFGSGGDEAEEREHDRIAERDREHELRQIEMAAQAEVHKMQRNNRLLVGGRAHVRKRGLS